jgi:alpha-tubulin suppressor-like RCC1 family protein
LWGSNSTGQIGDGTIESKNKPTTIKYFNDRTDLRISKVSSGNGRTAVITTDGQLLVWGSNYYGQLGDGSKNNSYIPINITANGSTSGDINAGHFLTKTIEE